MFKFTIRELLLLTLVVGLAVAWAVDRSQTAKQEQFWRSAAVTFAVRLATATGKPVEFTTPDGEKSFLLGSR